MNDLVIAVLAWIGFSPVAGVAIGNFLRRADERSRACGDVTVNRRRPDRLPYVMANQVVTVKHASTR